MSARSELQSLLLEQLCPSPTNPRKTFDPVALQELADSIAEKGLIQPIVVRPRHNSRGAPVEVALYEVVAGERRYRAAKLAGLEQVPCIVRELDDVAVLEIQVVENNQREDVHPLEEADGFARLMKVDGYSVERIAQRIGTSTKYVYDRVKLLQLVPELQKVFVEGEISAGHAILLARLTPEEQRNVSSSDWSGLWTGQHGTQADLGLEDAPPALTRKAVSVRELGAYIEQNVRFRPEDVDLPNLFPDTAVQLEVAQEQDLKVVMITREYRVPDRAKAEGERTYGADHWLRVDGQPDKGRWNGTDQKPLERCGHARMGVVVAGPGRGDSFLVCVDKKKCDLHWKEKRTKKAKNTSGSSQRDSYAKQQEKWRLEREEADRERARWKKALKGLKEAALKALDDGEVASALDLLEDLLAGWGGAKKLTKGTVEERLRQLAKKNLVEELSGSYPRPDAITNKLKRLGLDAKQIVNEVAPKPKPERKKAPKKAAKKKAKARKKAKA